MAARVGLFLPHALLVSSARALPTPRARLSYPPPPIPTYRRRASSSFASRPRRASPRLLPVRAMASGNPYAAELAAAKKAVTLAARLCKVRGYHGPAAGIVRCFRFQNSKIVLNDNTD